ncbi:MAG: DUF4398 domain-containing protein [Desulfobacterales bacterium]
MQNKTSSIQLFFIGALAMLLTVGCASSGSLSTATTKISESEKAISIARESNKSTRTSVDLRNAEAKLEQAKIAFTDEEYLEATRLAEQATVDADYARIEANAEKAKKDSDQMRQNVRNLHQDLEQMSDR